MMLVTLLRDMANELADTTADEIRPSVARAVQQALKITGDYAGRIDAHIGEKTQAAIVSIRKRKTDLLADIDSSAEEIFNKFERITADDVDQMADAIEAEYSDDPERVLNLIADDDE